MSSSLVRGSSSASSVSSSSSSFSSSSSSSVVPMIRASRAVNLFALGKIEEIIKNAIKLHIDLGTPLSSENLPTEKQLQNLVDKLVQFVRKSDQLQLHEEVSTKRIDYYLQDAAWIHVGDSYTGTSVLMLDSHKLGEGGECAVYSGFRKKEGDLVAVKVRNEETNPSQEMEMFHKLSFSPHIIKRFSSSEWYQIEEMCSKGSLYYVSKNEKSFLNEHLSKINKGILEGIAHFHDCGIIYGDMKLENLLLTETGEVKFSDLGKSYYVQNAPRGGTHVFLAPEQIYRCIQIMDHDQPNVPLRFPEKAEVWQVMLALAQLNKANLSQPFKERLKQYRKDLIQLANESERVTENALDSGSGPQTANLMGYQYLMRNASRLFETMHENRKERALNIEGLFSDLPPTTNLERLLIQMSYYDVRKRMNAHEALEFFKSYCA